MIVIIMITVVILVNREKFPPPFIQAEDALQLMDRKPNYESNLRSRLYTSAFRLDVLRRFTLLLKIG